MPLTDNRKLLDEVRDVMRLHHYSIHTERTYTRMDKEIRTLSRYGMNYPAASYGVSHSLCVIPDLIRHPVGLSGFRLSPV